MKAHLQGFLVPVSSHAALMSAIKVFDTKKVEELVRLGIDVKQGNHSAWHRACFEGEETIIDLLIEAGADVRSHDDYALRAAAGFNSLDFIKKFIALGADPNANKGQAVANAIGHGNVEALQFLLDSGANPNLNRGQFLCDAAVSDEFAEEMLAALISSGGQFEEEMRLKEYLDLIEELDFEPLDLMVRYGLDPGHPSINELAQAGHARLKAWQDRKVLELSMDAKDKGNPGNTKKSAIKRSASL